MGTRPSVTPRPGYKILDLSGKDIVPKSRPSRIDLHGTSLSTPSSQRKRRGKSKKVTFEREREVFTLVKTLSSEQAEKLDKLRDDLEESIARVVRVQRAFVKELDAVQNKAVRIKQIKKALEILPFYAESQTKVVSDHIQDILESKAAYAKQLEKEYEEKKRLKELKEDHKYCLGCEDCQDLE